MKEKIQSIISEIHSELEKNKLKENTMLYDKYRSAKWFLEDISEAVEAYKNYERKEKELDLGTKYLMIYGVFTALYLQQEALNDFRHALNYEKVDYEKNYPEIYKIRETRNDVAGHPTYRKRGYSTCISRFTLKGKLSLKELQYQETKNDEFIDVDIISSIDTQEKFIKEQLEEILSKLRDETKEHIEKFKNDKLADCFREFIYARSKIYSDGFYTQNDPMGFNLVKGIIEKLKEKLNERFVDWKQTDFKNNIENVEEIYNYLLSKPEIINTKINHEDDDKKGINENEFLKRNLLEHMFCKLEELKDRAEEVDTEYENNFETKFEDNDTIEKIEVVFVGKDDAS